MKEQPPEAVIQTLRDRPDSRKVGFGSYSDHTYGDEYWDVRSAWDGNSYFEYPKKLKNAGRLTSPGLRLFLE